MRNKYLYLEQQGEIKPFENAEEAWFWCCLCDQMDKGYGRGGGPKTARPCETSDIIIAVKRLFQKGVLRASHIKVLSKYGHSQVPPHPHFGDSSRICHLWQEALDFLGTLLKQKGIVTT